MTNTTPAVEISPRSGDSRYPWLAVSQIDGRYTMYATEAEAIADAPEFLRRNAERDAAVAAQRALRAAEEAAFSARPRRSTRYGDGGIGDIEQI